jgi:hypothetical protein
MAEGLLLLHLCGGIDGDVIIVYSHGHVIMCKIAAQPHGPVR